MEKVLDELWKIIVYSLISLFIVINLLRYLENNDWWKIEKTKGWEKTPDQSLVFYFVNGNLTEDEIRAEIFVKNVSQEILRGRRGFFQKIFPGQYFFLRIDYQDQIAYSPIYILRTGEIRRLNFNYSEESRNLTFVGSDSRKLPFEKPPELVRFWWQKTSQILPKNF